MENFGIYASCIKRIAFKEMKTITRQLSKVQEQEDLLRWSAAQLSEVKQIIQLLLVHQKSQETEVEANVISDSFNQKFIRSPLQINLS